MKTRLLLPIACIAGLCVTAASAQSSLDPRTLTADLPFAMAPVALPRIPARTCRITDHGARGDGATLNTEAIAAAIDACSKAGGGRVVVPRGIFLTGPIELKSRIDLHLERGALLRFSPRFELYPLVRASYEGGDRVKARSPIWAKGAEDIAITGEGVIDGSGQAWRPVKKFKMTANQWKALVASGGVVDASGENWWPSREAMNGEATVKALDARGPGVPLAEYAAAREFLRPVMISLVECRRVLLDGPTFQNSPAWNIHPLLCEDMVIRNITVLNPWYSQNGDGLDLDSCRRVIVHNCTVRRRRRCHLHQVGEGRGGPEARAADRGRRHRRQHRLSRPRRLHRGQRDVGRRAQHPRRAVHVPGHGHRRCASRPRAGGAAWSRRSGSATCR